MALPKVIKDAWTNRKGPAVLATTDTKGNPNVIYIGAVGRYEDLLVVADNYFDKTKANIQDGSTGAWLFITEDGTSYQLKGSLSTHEDGPIFEAMKKWNPPQHPGRAAVALRVDEAYQGAKRLL